MPKYTGTTDERHVITLPSAIESVRWSRRRAAPGGIVGLEVQTLFCGTGSQIEIALVDAQGTTHASLSGQLTGTPLNVDLRVPENATGGTMLWWSGAFGLPPEERTPFYLLEEQWTRRAAARLRSEWGIKDIETVMADEKGYEADGRAAMKTLQWWGGAAAAGVALPAGDGRPSGPVLGDARGLRAVAADTGDGAGGAS